MSFQEFLNSLHRQEDGSCHFGYDPARPMAFMVLGTTPQHLKKVWDAAQQELKLKINELEDRLYECREMHE